jgi:alpha-L-fucosidase
MPVPPHLAAYSKQYRATPRQAALAWFRNADWGLFIHYGLYSLLGKGEWVMHGDKIPVQEYAKLKDRFTAANFDPDFITDLALEAKMSYITLVCKHCDSFALWETQYSDFNSVNSPAKRDLVAEMDKACREKGLGLFTFYEHGVDWRHPHAPRQPMYSWDGTRPQYDQPDPHYATGEAYDLEKYIAYANGQVRELVSQYGPLAGVWLDGAAAPNSGPTERYRLDKLYRSIRRIEPHALISYKQGVTGNEDFQAPESHWVKQDDTFEKPVEICMPLQLEVPEGSHNKWGYVKGATHATADQIWQKLQWAQSKNANLLANVGPLPDGSIHPEDVAALREVGRRLSG